MTRAEAQYNGWEYFETPPACLYGDHDCCQCGGENHSAGYLEMEGDYWCCEPCMKKMEPERRPLQHMDPAL